MPVLPNPRTGGLSLFLCATLVPLAAFLVVNACTPPVMGSSLSVSMDTVHALQLCPCPFTFQWLREQWLCPQPWGLWSTSVPYGHVPGLLKLSVEPTLVPLNPFS